MQTTRTAVVIVNWNSVDEAHAGLVDRLIHARYRGLGVTTTTFERKQGALEGAARLRVQSPR